MYDTDDIVLIYLLFVVIVVGCVVFVGVVICCSSFGSFRFALVTFDLTFVPVVGICSMFSATVTFHTVPRCLQPCLFSVVTACT